MDDGSRDGSFDQVEALHELDPHVRAIRFRRNFGKTPALVAGFQEARGDVIFTMDADLQDDPAEIRSSSPSWMKATLSSPAGSIPP